MEQPTAPETTSSNWVDSADIHLLNQQIVGQEVIEERVPIVVFKIGRESYALPINMVREVMKLTDVTPIPQAPDYILGVSNIRGNVYAALDLAIKIDPANAQKERSGGAFIVLIKDSNIQVGVVVESVPTTILVNKSEIDTSAAIIENLSLEDAFIDGIVKTKEEMIIMINVLEMLKAEEN